MRAEVGEERKLLLDHEREARLAAEQANRSKDEFLALLGHELRNPLAPIFTALQLINLCKGESADRERAIMEPAVNHLARLVDDLLDVSRMKRGNVHLKKESLEIATVVAKALEMASPLIEGRMHYLSVAVPNRELLVNGDSGTLDAGDFEPSHQRREIHRTDRTDLDRRQAQLKGNRTQRA